MTWLHFTTWVLVLYGVYYGAVIAWDFLRNRKSTPENAAPVLTFAPHVDAPKVVADDPVTKASEASAEGLGGVGLRQLFALCRDEAVDYRKAVSF